MEVKQEPTITRDQARNALECIAATVKTAFHAIEAAPYGAAKPAASALSMLEESVAGELGLEVIGHCECGVMIFDGDDYIHTRDGCNLCAECRPSDEDLAKIAAIQAACPKGDPECEAQTEDDDHGRCWSESERDYVIVDAPSGQGSASDQSDQEPAG